MRCFVAAKSDKCSKKDINTVLCGRTFSGSLIPFTGICGGDKDFLINEICYYAKNITFFYLILLDIF